MVELLQLSRGGNDRANLHPEYTSVTEWNRDDDTGRWLLAAFS